MCMQWIPGLPSPSPSDGLGTRLAYKARVVFRGARGCFRLPLHPQIFTYMLYGVAFFSQALLMIADVIDTTCGITYANITTCFKTSGLLK